MNEPTRGMKRFLPRRAKRGKIKIKQGLKKVKGDKTL